jgi:hypothetical protein
VNGSLPLRWRVHAAASAAVVPALIRFVSFSRLAAWLGRAPDALPASAATVDAAALARWVDRLMRSAPPPWRYTCLARSAVLYHLLRRAGHPVELWVGVRRDVAPAAAHAWLVRDGQPYLESEPEIPVLHHATARVLDE